MEESYFNELIFNAVIGDSNAIKSIDSLLRPYLSSHHYPESFITYNERQGINKEMIGLLINQSIEGSEEAISFLKQLIGKVKINDLEERLMVLEQKNNPEIIQLVLDHVYNQEGEITLLQQRIISQSIKYFADDCGIDYRLSRIMLNHDEITVDDESLFNLKNKIFSRKNQSLESLMMLMSVYRRNKRLLSKYERKKMIKWAKNRILDFKWAGIETNKIKPFWLRLLSAYAQWKDKRKMYYLD